MKWLIMSALLTVVSCQEKVQESQQSSNDPVAEAIESALTAVGGAADDGSNESVVASRSNPVIEALIPSAYAVSCNRILSGANGVCQRNVNCESGPYLWSGSVQLTFDNGASCSFSGVGDRFVREVDFLRQGPRGSVSTTSDTKVNYLGQNVGGGVEVEKISGGFELSILGQSKILTGPRGRVMANMSAVTSTPLTMNQLGRNGRTVSSGVIEIFHNKAQFTAEHSFSNVTWSSGCCYPVSGSISVTLSGSRTGFGTVTFNGCGNVTTTFDSTRSFTLANCE